ncbi:hypothetical protein [uncultured Pseudacidovorax sp.]|uniref:hypothetical protein n=1 Tax=uncultured Pseudacidovorax sp. TaxID=679313 RepID=UPI0025EA464F|nr:hypothetical protein [uncultured Pseudacidovorax sp.]
MSELYFWTAFAFVIGACAGVMVVALCNAAAEGDRRFERDAARYAYLRMRPLDTIQRGGVFAGLVPANVVLNGDDLDAAVDAAMAAGLDSNHGAAP